MTASYIIWPYDCTDAMLHLMDEESVHVVITSPPYYRKRDYGHNGQLGHEATPQEYVVRLVQVARAIKRVLRRDGTFWLNLGDTYASRSTYNSPQTRTTRNGWKQAGRGPNTGGVPTGFKDKDLLGIPWRVALALQADGWYLRQAIVWHKPNPNTESVKDRCTQSYEHIFMFSRSPRYFYDAAAIAEPFTTDPKENYPARSRVTKRGDQAAALVRGNDRGKSGGFPAPAGMRNKRDVWTVPTRAFKGAHFATFPPDLIEPCILAGCPEGGTVLDPFGGSGTTAMVALRHNRNAVLCELNPAYVEMAHHRIAGGK
jgi:DNA modification methylase